ncbi:MAG: bifunctional oligoribonuclease/PAP phosphatase NrnA [Bacteroidetes bacterium]|nr:bifunctional oligoribonuclease/PAP phosphatase NrnA [Bacteroidota bacterium]
MIGDIVPLLTNAKRVVISTHTRPDGDAIGSQLAIGAFLEQRGTEVWMINSDPVPYNLEWMQGVDRIRVYDHSLDLVEAIASADVVIVVDTNAASRLGTSGNQLKAANGKKVLIDHHTDPEDWFDFSHRREDASSTGELLYELMAGWDLSGITPAVAEPLYVAIMTDTGSFRYSNVTPVLHRMTADLIERGELDAAHIHGQVYDRKSMEGLRLMSAVLGTMQLHFDGLVGTMVVTRQFLADSGASVEETDGFVNLLLSVEGVQVALMFTETAKGTKISFRSKGNWHVHKWAQSLGGGGHRNASGAFQHSSLDETVQKAVNTASRFLDLPESGPGPELSEDDVEYLAMLGEKN